jgi:hypothetical protein
VLDETLKPGSQSNIATGDGLQIYAFAFSPSGGGRATFCTLPSQRHGTHSETCRSLVMDVGFQGESGSNVDVAQSSLLTLLRHEALLASVDFTELASAHS